MDHTDANAHFNQHDMYAQLSMDEDKLPRLAKKMTKISKSFNGI